jgi:hypothetical protein
MDWQEWLYRAKPALSGIAVGLAIVFSLSPLIRLLAIWHCFWWPFTYACQ